MPTYEYACDACSHLFEKFQSMTEKPIRKCQKCGKNEVSRLISAGAGILFKGSGFYQTDYRSKSYHEAAKKESPSPASEGHASTAGSSEKKAKPASPTPKNSSKK